MVARDPDADRGVHGRECGHPDHDGGGARLATRELGRTNAWRIIRREAAVGLLNGLAFAAILGSLAGLWFHSIDLELVIALALVTVLSRGAGGIFVPLTLNRFGWTPRSPPAPS